MILLTTGCLIHAVGAEKEEGRGRRGDNHRRVGPPAIDQHCLCLTLCALFVCSFFVCPFCMPGITLYAQLGHLEPGCAALRVPVPVRTCICVSYE